MLPNLQRFLLFLLPLALPVSAAPPHPCFVQCTLTLCSQTRQSRKSNPLQGWGAVCTPSGQTVSAPHPHSHSPAVYTHTVLAATAGTTAPADISSSSSSSETEASPSRHREVITVSSSASSVSPPKRRAASAAGGGGAAGKRAPAAAGGVGASPSVTLAATDGTRGTRAPQCTLPPSHHTWCTLTPPAASLQLGSCFRATDANAAKIFIKTEWKQAHGGKIQCINSRLVRAHVLVLFLQISCTHHADLT